MKAVQDKVINQLNKIGQQKISDAKPLLKWAGGKGQLLKELDKHIPVKYGKYIEPFFGGGALYFHVQPGSAVIADSNPELINLYKTIAIKPQEVIKELKQFINNKDFFLEVRSQDWKELTNVKAAARTIFLNKTCFNGLYRVNKSGGFNVPYANYKNPKIVNEKTIMAASKLLRNADIICGDYKNVLKKYAKKGDFIFLDPPYLPVAKFSDFQRYTKEQFYEEDQVDLANEVKRLVAMGCYVVLTNSNHPLVHKMYEDYAIEVIQTKRHINSDSTKRTGEDVIVVAIPGVKTNNQFTNINISNQITKYPSTRYMGSKNKLLDSIWNVASQFQFNTVLDLFSGSGVVSYMFKAQGKEVISNDYMCMASMYAKSLIENNNTRLSAKDIDILFSETKDCDFYVSQKFKGLYFSDDDNRFIDLIRTNSKRLKGAKRSLAMTALIRACIKKRPRGIFTYVGHKYDDGRRDLRLSFREQYLNAVKNINEAVFDNGKKNTAIWGDALTLNATADLVYIDPPYFSPLSDNEYVRRYHFVEGLARDWKGVEIQENTLTKKFKSYPTPFSTQQGTREAFDRLFKKYKDSVLIVSYSSNSLPTMNEMIEIMSRHKKHVDVVLVDHQYSFGNQGHKVANKNNAVKEYLFIGH